MKDICGNEITIERLSNEITFLNATKARALKEILFLETEIKSIAKFLYLRKHQMFDDELFGITTREALDIIKKEIKTKKKL